MRIQQLALGTAALMLSTLPASAGDCSQAMAETQAKINAKLGAAASARQPAPESSAEKMHRQPTPGSITAAETKLGDVSSETAQTVKAAMVRAREADRAGDQRACEQALADALRALGP